MTTKIGQIVAGYFLAHPVSVCPHCNSTVNQARFTTKL